MHETAIAEGIFKVIVKEAEKQKAKPVSATMTCGQLNAVNDEILRFAFDAIAKETICQGMELKIVHKQLQGRCKDCDKQFDVDITNPRCGNCGADNFFLLPDEPIVLTEIEFDAE